MESICFRSVLGAGDEKENGVVSGLVHSASIEGKDLQVDDRVCGYKSPEDGGRHSGEKVDVNMERFVEIDQLIASLGL
jgi:hypothetical protein